MSQAIDRNPCVPVSGRWAVLEGGKKSEKENIVSVLQRTEVAAHLTD
jgi:hypothetical protein